MERIEKIEVHRRDHWQWAYDFEGTLDDLTGLRADWQAGRLVIPDGVSERVRANLEEELLGPPAPMDGRFRAYRETWYGEILARYEDSETKLVFLRLPRGPVVPPHSVGGTSVIRDLAVRPNVIAMDEGTFDALEDPAYFHDALHLNAKGCGIFSALLAEKIAELLGPGS